MISRSILRRLIRLSDPDGAAGGPQGGGAGDSDRQVARLARKPCRAASGATRVASNPCHPDRGGVHAPPRNSATPSDVSLLCGLADRHSVLPAVVNNLNRAEGDAVAAALAAPRRQLMRRTAVSLLLRRQLAEIQAAFNDADVTSVVVKGPEFADRLYPRPALRPFTDLDLLIPPDARNAAAAAMETLGYGLVSQPGRKYDTEYGEQTWHRDDTGRTGGDVEIHWDLVNSPTLRAGVSVGYSDLATDGEMSPAALLIVAAVHGAASHQFDRLGLLWDVAQAARGRAGKIDRSWLTDTARRTGCGLAVAMALHLAAATLGEPAAAALLRDLGLPRPSLTARWLVTPAVVLGRRTPFVTARRLGFRQMLKRP